MVEKPPSIIYTSNPPQWDRIMWCVCGYQENMGRVRAKSLEEQLRDEWEKANTPDQGNKMDTTIAHE